MQMKIQNYLLAVITTVLLSACSDASDTETSSTSATAQSVADNQRDVRAPGENIQLLGGINASLNGEKHGWFVTAEKSGDIWRSQSDVNNAGGINIYGHATADTTRSDKDALLIGATVREVGADMQVSDIEITFLKGGFGSGSYSSENDGEAEIEITNMVDDDGLSHVVGTFSATLPYKKYSSREVESDNVVTIKRGRFNVKLPPLLK